MAYSSNKEYLIEVFKDTENWYKTDKELIEHVNESKRHTEIYKEKDYPDITYVTCKGKPAKIMVTKGRTFESAIKLMEEYPNKRVLVHNFASATNPGGGVLKGSSTQEESLCRCSTLYPTLTTSECNNGYYKYHKNLHNMLYTDTCIYSPNILIIKSDTIKPERLPKDKWRTVDIITCPAPNLRDEAAKTSDKQLFEIHKNRARHMITIAIAHGVDVLVLGAFGCGAFKNKPEIVARAYKEVIMDFRNFFDAIEFAVYCKATEDENYKTFNRILGNIK